MKLSVCMIVKNEEAMLAGALESVLEADEIIVCDTGSTDCTVEIAKQYTDKVYTDFVWCDDFAKARNHANSKATGDWILVIDADERLAPGHLSIIRFAISQAKLAVNCHVVSAAKDTDFYNIRVYKNCPEVFWKGAAHNHISVPADASCDAVITFGYSPAHKLDPDRTLRILDRAVREHPESPREWYYLAREYWYRHDYYRTVSTLDVYIPLSKNIPERADAYLMKARALWAMKRGDEARQACMFAIINNANFKEAVLFMADMSWKKNADTWKKFAGCCTNEGILFKRVD